MSVELAEAKVGVREFTWMVMAFVSKQVELFLVIEYVVVVFGVMARVFVVARVEVPEVQVYPPVAPVAVNVAELPIHNTMVVVEGAWLGVCTT
jgi:hypothetical protein